MTKHPGLDNLIRFSNLRRDNGDRILKTDFVNRGIKKSLDEIKSPLLTAICNLGCKVLGPGDRQVGARGVGDHEVPAFVDDTKDIFFEMWAGRLGGQQVTGDCLVAPGEERITHHARVLTSN
jgi:hypothetical protein